MEWNARRAYTRQWMDVHYDAVMAAIRDCSNTPLIADECHDFMNLFEELAEDILRQWDEAKEKANDSA